MRRLRDSDHLWVHRPEEDPDFYRQRADEAHPVHVWGVRLFSFGLAVVYGAVMLRIGGAL